MPELTISTYKRIYFTNCFLTIPLIVLFAWPYFYLTMLSGLGVVFQYIGAFVFSIPFMLTIMHGLVTISLGTVHRHHYYNWMLDNPLTWGLLFHPMFVKTRFRIIMLIISFLMLPAGFISA